MSDLLLHINYTASENLTQGLTEEIDDYEEVTIDFGSEIKNNSATIKLKNDAIDVLSDGTVRHRWVDSDGVIKFKAVKTTAGQIIPEELVDIYGTYTELDPSIDVENDSYLLFQGVIKKGTIRSKSEMNQIELTCLDRNSVAMDKLAVPQAFNEGQGLASPDIQKRILQLAGSVGSGSYGFDASGNRGLGYPYYIDARLFSEGIVDSGTTTSASTKKLIESGQNFTSTVSKGDWVRNTVTNQYAYVLAIDSNTQISLSKDIMSSGQGYQISDGFIQDTRPDGTAFPTIAFSYFDKPITELLATLSQTGNTNDTDEQDPTTGTLVVKRSGRWFLDKQSRYHWYVPDDTPEHIMKVGQSSAISPDTVNHKIIDVELSNEVMGNVNFIIFKAGEDMDGEMIKSYSRAPFSGAPEEKDSLRVWEDIARGMKHQDEQAGNITKDSSDTFSYPSSYPMTPAWDRQARSVANDGAYNTNFIEEAILRGRERCGEVFRKLAFPRWSGRIQIRGEDISVGDLIQFTDRRQGIIDIKVRVNQATHTITPATGWITSLTVEEDEIEVEKNINI